MTILLFLSAEAKLKILLAETIKARRINTDCKCTARDFPRWSSSMLSYALNYAQSNLYLKPFNCRFLDQVRSMYKPICEHSLIIGQTDKRFGDGISAELKSLHPK